MYSDIMNGTTIQEGEECMGEWFGVQCHLTTDKFVKTADGYYRCPGCKYLYEKLEDGSYKVLGITVPNL